MPLNAMEHHDLCYLRISLRVIKNSQDHRTKGRTFPLPKAAPLGKTRETENPLGLLARPYQSHSSEDQ